MVNSRRTDKQARKAKEKEDKGYDLKSGSSVAQFEDTEQKSDE